MAGTAETHAPSSSSPFLLHYLHCTLIYPLKLFLRNCGRKIKNPYFPVCGHDYIWVNLLNAYLQARWVSEYDDRWF
ncbi:hypothetical protein ACS0TY_025092 [Phlomoides rotata]